MNLAPPLVIFTNIAICDGCGHEIKVWTDGRTAYATTFDNWDASSYDRSGNLLTVWCGAVDVVTDERCTGFVLFDLSARAGRESWKVRTPDLLRMLSYGEPVVTP